MNLVIVLGFVFGAVVLMGWGISVTISRPRQVVKERLKDFVDQTHRAEIAQMKGEKIEEPEKKKDDIFAGIDKVLEKRTFVQKMILEFQKADLKLRYSEYIGIYILATILPGVLGWLIMGNITGFLMLAIPGVVFPRLYVRFRQMQRIKHVDNQLVDALMLISNSLKSGYSFQQGLELCSEESPPPISTEFKRVLMETNLGMQMDEALDNLGERVPSEDLDLVVTAVKIQRQIGGNLSEILDRIVHTIRERIRIKGEISTLTAQGKLQGIILTLLPPGLTMAIYMMDPEFMQPLFFTMIGKMLLAVAIVLQIFGAIMIKKIVDIKV
jgi:tight adherence protein B